MGLLARLRKQRGQARRELQDIIDACDSESRDMNDGEASKVDALASKIEELETRIASLEQAEEVEEEGDGEPVRSLGGFSGHGTATPVRRRAGRRSRPMGEGPAIHTRGQERYNLLRAIRGAIEGRVDGLEGEVSQEVMRRAIRTGRSIPPGQFSMPMGLDRELHEFMYPGSTRGDGPRGSTRDLTTTTGAGAIFTLPETPFIELLRARLVLRQLGITVLDDLQGLLAIPRQTGAATVNWVGEGVSASPSNQTEDNVPFSPHTAIALTNISYMFALQTSLSAEAYVKNDLAKQMALACDLVGINGTGGAQPTGVLQNSTIQTRSTGLAIGTNGGNPTYANVIAMESLISTANADFGNLAFLTNPAVRGWFRNVAVLNNTTALPVWQGVQGQPGRGEMANYPAFVTTQVPSNLTKGTGTALSAIIFGDWSDLVMGVWDDALSFLVNPYTNQANGGVTISTTMAVDFNARHPESFAIVTDAKTV